MKIDLYKLMFLVFTLIIINFYPASSFTLYQQRNYLFNSTLHSSDIYDIMSNITENKLEKHIHEIEQFGPHPTGSNELISVENYILNELSKTGLIIKLKEWSLKGKTGNNIEATLEGNRKSESIVIVCAHYDSVEISPGADDDGSGVSAILTFAEIISKYTFICTIKLVLFSGEEQGHLGSSVYAKEAFENSDNIIAVINLDGIGYALNYEKGKFIRNLCEDDDQWIVNIGKEVSDEFSELVDLTIVQYPNTIHADHQPFIDKGYDAVYFLENDLNPFYHTSEDKSEHMNFTYLKKVSSLAIGTLIKIANLEPIIKENDIKITIRGMLLSNPAQLSISIKNTCYPQDTANLSINISLINIITGKYVHGMHESVTYWNIKKEIKDKWDFKIGNRYYKLEPMVCRVRITGYNDDISIYKELKTFGIVFKPFLFIIPISK